MSFAREPSARSLYRTGRKYEKRKDYTNAYLYYTRAAAIDPAKKEYWQRAQALQRRAIEGAATPPSFGSSSNSPAPPDTTVTLPTANVDDLREARKIQPPTELQASPELKNFRLRGDSRTLWEQVTKGYGLGVVFDGDYEPGPQRPLELEQADYRTALVALMTSTGSFIVPISEKLMLVVKDTEPKRREVENTMAVSIPIPEAFSLQEAQELARSVQQVMEIQRFSIDSSHRVVILRDRVSKVKPAEILFNDLMHSKAQVLVEVEFLAYSRSKSRTLGTNLQTRFPVAPLVKALTLAGGPVSFGLSIAGANIIATAANSESKVLYHAELRSMSNQTASLLFGQKYPIQSNSYIGNVPSGSTAYSPPVSFNFEDLGFNIKITPRVHDRDELTMEVETEFKLLGVGSLNGIPVISNRKFATQARLRFDQAAIIAGLVTASDVRTLSGPAGLLSVPALGTLLGNTTTAEDDVEILLVMRPHLLTLPGADFVTHEIWLGSEGRPRIPM